MGWRRATRPSAIPFGLKDPRLKEVRMATLAKDIGAPTAQRKWSRSRRRENLYGYLFLTPWLLGFFGLFLGPGLVSLYLSLTKYDVLSPPEFIGATNYVKMFTDDELFWPSLWRTFYFAG